MQGNQGHELQKKVRDMFKEIIEIKRIFFTKMDLVKD